MGFLMINRKRVGFYVKKIQAAGHFEFGLNKRGQEVTNEVCDEILASVIAPLLGVSDKAIVLWDFRELSAQPPKPPLPVIKASTKYEMEVDIAKTGLESHRFFWRWVLRGMNGAQANLGLELPVSKIPVAEIAKHSWDPTLVVNLRRFKTAVAWNFASDRTLASKSARFLFGHNALGLYASVFAAPEVLKTVYVECAKRCQFTGLGLKEELRPPCVKKKQHHARSNK